jgi:hypothetical protein
MFHAVFYDIFINFSVGVACIVCSLDVSNSVGVYNCILKSCKQAQDAYQLILGLLVL